MLDLDKTKEELSAIVDFALAKLSHETEDHIRHKPSPDKWSKIQIIGHLVDLGFNNHQRWIRVLQGDPITISYQQDDWVSIQNYQSSDIKLTMDLWIAINKHLIWILNNLQPYQLDFKYFDGEKEVTLGFLIEDYLEHLKHHLKQIISTI